MRALGGHRDEDPGGRSCPQPRACAAGRDAVLAHGCVAVLLRVFLSMHKEPSRSPCPHSAPHTSLLISSLSIIPRGELGDQEFPRSLAALTVIAGTRRRGRGRSMTFSQPCWPRVSRRRGGEKPFLFSLGNTIVTLMLTCMTFSVFAKLTRLRPHHS